MEGRNDEDDGYSEKVCASEPSLSYIPLVLCQGWRSGAAPYLIFLWFFAKVGEAVRLAPGVDASTKLLGLADGFTLAFQTSMPGAAVDWLVGLIGAALVRLVVYVKGKNAKKYRKDVEYGSARWGTKADIAPFMDPKPENNIILTQTEGLMMSGRPKNPAFARNKNVLVVGGSGSGGLTGNA